MIYLHIQTKWHKLMKTKVYRIRNAPLSTDPIEEHKDTFNLDLEVAHLQRVCLDRSYFKYCLYFQSQ